MTSAHILMEQNAPSGTSWDTICGTCGNRYGQHNGNACPNPETGAWLDGVGFVIKRDPVPASSAAQAAYEVFEPLGDWTLIGSSSRAVWGRVAAAVQQHGRPLPTESREAHIGKVGNHEVERAQRKRRMRCSSRSATGLGSSSRAVWGRVAAAVQQHGRPLPTESREAHIGKDSDGDSQLKCWNCGEEDFKYVESSVVIWYAHRNYSETISFNLPEVDNEGDGDPGLVCRYCDKVNTLPDDWELDFE